ncbi:selenium metabolism-associated LysR family transcriptional regulator [Nitratidesulfovibrio vulgaris]|uniref:Transcriptional regulator, LysR family n=1 Tax=Nitratidesulfovibrio vulgaris (strain DP4) TaxID=391774 RepID=A0A0H3A8W6_NITV4|nr:selenium metabolism-associated LysR family transcriptional regulator [Nitratidesulfovibrio vulgaris]ABM28754.1 transcriptional regulator, LysR family [Nitratidesulfovibrio vulgaris DP4]
MIDYRRLEAFCKVYELRSFSRAGEELFLSQPTISAHVLALEKDLGMQLLDRLGRSVLPTPAGDVLYRHAMNAFESLEAAKSELAMLRDEVSGELVLGGSTIPAHHILPPVLGTFLRRHPCVSVKICVGDTEDIMQSVAQGEVMLGLVGDLRPQPDLHFEAVIDDELVVIAHPQMVEGGVPHAVAELASYPWVMREKGSGTRSAFLNGLDALGVDWRLFDVVLTVGSTEAVIQYVRAGLGISVTSRIAVADALGRGELVEIPLSDYHPARKFYCIHHARRTLFPSALAFMTALREGARVVAEDGESHDR